MPVDSFKFLPRLIAAFYQMTEREPELPIPWTPLPQPLSECTVGLVTSGGLYRLGVEPPFDLAHEQEEPTWGDPSYRVIPADIRQNELGASHLHINTRPALEDVNVLLPIDRLHELATAGVIGDAAREHFAFMGFQNYPPDATVWRERYGPEVAARFKAAKVDCVLLTPA